MIFFTLLLVFWWIFKVYLRKEWDEIHSNLDRFASEGADPQRIKLVRDTMEAGVKPPSHTTLAVTGILIGSLLLAVVFL